MVGRTALRIAAGLLATGIAWAAPPPRYSFGEVVSVEMPQEMYSTSPLEDKRYFDCDRFKLRPEHVKFALRHSRQVTEEYWMSDIRYVSIGCYATVTVRFRNGDEADVILEPFGKVFARPRNGRAANEALFYICRRCSETAWFDDPAGARLKRDARR